LFGSKPRPFSSDSFQKDIALIKKLYSYKGYFAAEIDTSIVREENGRKVHLKITIRENKPSRIDSLRYEGIETLSETVRKNYLRQRKLNVKNIFSVERLIEERDRSVSFFRDNGYLLFQQDSIRIRIDTAGTSAGVLFRVNLPGQVRYGPVNVVVHNPVKNDSSNSVKTFSKDRIEGKIFGRGKVSPVLITSAIGFRPGELTNQSLERKTVENLGGTGMFSSIYINPDSVRAGELSTTLHLEPAPKHQFEPKLLLDNRYGALFYGGSLAYENKNLFGAAEQLQTSVEYGRQAGYSDRLLGSLTPDEYDRIIPYEFRLKSTLLMPVKKHPGNFYSATAEFSSMKQPVLLSSRNALLRGSYSAKLTNASRMSFDFFEVESIKQDSIRGFKKLFTSELAGNIGIDPDKPERVAAAIDSLLETRINQTFRIRYNYTNRQKVAPEKTVMNLDLLLEHAGLLPWLLDKYADTKSYDGFTESDPQIFGTAYSQYMKIESGLSLSKNLTPDTQIAGRILAGYMSPWGKAQSTPEERRFYAGGSNSMRGWLFNTLGPASCASEAASNFGADIKLELNLEYRMKFFKLFGQPSGITFFSDTGNIWDRSGPYGLTLKSLTNDFAWDVGVGLRLGSPVGPFRFDFAWKVHDPAEADPWVINRWKPGEFTFSFGIGEAF
ncbi:MAG: BamA/TamA family outer membrane protein, partial [Chlorobiaceae bacterium]|nr:BamA/TamA family outer membrane protein [Chlorobiaceae bacterium]